MDAPLRGRATNTKRRNDKEHHETQFIQFGTFRPASNVSQQNSGDLRQETISPNIRDHDQNRRSQLSIPFNVSTYQSNSRRPPEEACPVPIHRPLQVGTAGVRSVRLLANYSPVSFNPHLEILHYDVDIRLPESPSLEIYLPKYVARQVHAELFSGQFFTKISAYDGRKNLYSIAPLPEGKYTVKNPDENLRQYIVTVKLVKSLQVNRLAEYFRGSPIGVPSDVLQALDVALDEHPNRCRFSVGRSFYRPANEPDSGIGCGIVALRGYQKSLKVTEQGLVINTDYTVTPFYDSIPVLDFLKENLGIDFRERECMTDTERRDVEKCLRGLAVQVTHRKTNQKNRIIGLTSRSAREMSFEMEEERQKEKSAKDRGAEGGDKKKKKKKKKKRNGGRESEKGEEEKRENKKTGEEERGREEKKKRIIGVVEYFKETHGIGLKCKELPCLDCSTKGRLNYIPMELCTIVEGQRFNKDMSQWESAQRELRKRCCASPVERCRTIREMMSADDGPCRGEVVHEFGLTVEGKMTELPGRVLRPPELQLGPSGRRQRLTPRDGDCQWNLQLSHVFEGKRIDCWAIAGFGRPNAFHRMRHLLHSFGASLSSRCGELGIPMRPQPLGVLPLNVEALGNPPELERHLASVLGEVGGHLQILICVMPGRHPGYKHLKRISETKIGFLTQCCLSRHAWGANPQFLANLALKINAKVGGSTVALSRPVDRQGETSGGVVYMGADVNHPGPGDSDGPSIAAVVASVNWPAANRYAAKIRAQKSREECMQGMEGMCRELLQVSSRARGGLPARIVLFRDGVSEGQFGKVLKDELGALKRACSSMANGYAPQITVVVAQKRHRTRLFTAEDVPKNVPAGTVVDTVIVHPREFDFFLCSHSGGLGTSRATHYQVLYDEHGYSSDGIQSMVNSLCYTFARCTKPVSLVPPVYYADLAAYRGRLYWEAYAESQSPASTVSSSSSATTSSLLSMGSFTSSSTSSSDYSGLPLPRSNVETLMYYC
ncbi:hypothetical protein AMTRI_Chr02g213020 [Amborella trichopoda]